MAPVSKSILTSPYFFCNSILMSSSSFLIEAKKFEEESELLGKKPIITYRYWKMMAKDVQDKLETFSTQKANRQSKRYKEEITI